MRLLYYPGCTLKTSAKNLEKSAICIMDALGHEVVEMEDWTCCGVASSLTDDDLMHHLAPLRNLIYAEDAGEDKIITICDMCYNTLKQTNLRVKEKIDDFKKQIHMQKTVSQEQEKQIEKVSKKLEKPAPVPSIFINGDLVFEAIPSQEELKEYIDGILE